MEAYRRWAPVIEQLKTRLASRQNSVPPKTAVVLDNAVTTYYALLQELEGVESDNQKLRSRLNAQQAEWDRLFDALPLACLITDVSGTILSANARAADFLHMSARHLEQRSLVYFLQENRDAFLRLLGELSSARGEVSTTAVIRPRERASLKIDLSAVQLAPDDASRWLWFLRPSSIRPDDAPTKASVF